MAPPASPFAVGEDGSALDPAAFRTAMRADAARLSALKEDDPTVAQLVMGDDTDALQVSVPRRHGTGVPSSRSPAPAATRMQICDT